MFSFVQFELLNQVPYLAIVDVKWIESENELDEPQAQPPCSYMLHLATGTVRQYCVLAISASSVLVLKLMPGPLV